MHNMGSKKLFHAVEALLYIAYNSGQGAISSRDIAARQGLPARYLEVLMQKLVKGGVLKGIRGPSGGYVLAKERRRISIADVIALMADDEKDQADIQSSALGEQVVRPVWQTAQRHMVEYLKKVNLAELCDMAEQKKIKKTAEEKFDFAI